MAKMYRTARGKKVDFETLRLKNELTPAVGNMRVNARGDQLGPGGKIVKTREEMLDEHYKVSQSGKRNNNVAKEDVIPTSSKKTKQKLAEPGGIQPTVAVPKATEIKFEEPVTAKVSKAEKIDEDDFVDPVTTKKVITNEYEITGDSEDNVAVDPLPATDKTSGVAIGEKSLKGGLAKAVAKTRDYETKKNKPKRL